MVIETLCLELFLQVLKGKYLALHNQATPHIQIHKRSKMCVKEKQGNPLVVEAFCLELLLQVFKRKYLPCQNQAATLRKYTSKANMCVKGIKGTQWWLKLFALSFSFRSWGANASDLQIKRPPSHIILLIMSQPYHPQQKKLLAAVQGLAAIVYDKICKFACGATAPNANSACMARSKESAIDYTIARSK